MQKHFGVKKKTMNKTDFRKHIVFLRRLPNTLMWGGLEKLMMDWFERIDYSACRVTLAISPGGKKLFKDKFDEMNLPIEIIEFPFLTCLISEFIQLY